MIHSEPFRIGYVDHRLEACCHALISSLLRVVYLVRTAGLGQGVPGVILELVACEHRVSNFGESIFFQPRWGDVLFIEAFWAALIP